MSTTFDPREASGESSMSGTRPLTLNEVSINGDGGVSEVSPGKYERKGGFFRKRILIGAPKDQKPEEVNLGPRIQVVFLKIRRKLVERGREGEIVRTTVEHNSPYDATILYEKDTKEKKAGVAKDLRAQFPNLRTVQIVYALLLTEAREPELVRVTIKGASLGSEVKEKDVPDFYSYISSYTGDDHFYQYKTNLTPILEKGKQDYFAVNFTRGEKLSEKSYEIALEQMKKVHENCKEVDMQRAARITRDATVDDVVPEALADAPPYDTGIDYPKDDINPDDIPF